ncbi:hypothetical protein ADICEAN_02727 [Cesiribacter andamanensis AMV16]|uniref:Uncharacterized protein n=1 Tax=Cesiribacter andamanensis AMV16 TaxID=1279009 RepID=M7NK61_9BACT|nr:hypothetical protein ADICEAN_02727 [Cesiribacter andamanensis AMV16]
MQRNVFGQYGKAGQLALFQHRVYPHLKDAVFPIYFHRLVIHLPLASQGGCIALLPELYHLLRKHLRELNTAGEANAKALLDAVGKGLVVIQQVVFLIYQPDGKRAVVQNAAHVGFLAHELLLKQHPLGYVPGVDHNTAHSLIVQQVVAVGFQKEVGAIGFFAAEHGRLAGAAVCYPQKETLLAVAQVIGMDVVEDGRIAHLFGPKAGKAVEGRGQVFDQPLAIGNADNVVGILDHRLKVIFAGLQVFQQHIGVLQVVLQGAFFFGQRGIQIAQLVNHSRELALLLAGHPKVQVGQQKGGQDRNQVVQNIGLVQIGGKPYCIGRKGTVQHPQAQDGAKGYGKHPQALADLAHIKHQGRAKDDGNKEQVPSAGVAPIQANHKAIAV